MTPDALDQAIDLTLHRRTDIDFMLLADRADVVGGKLYMLGGAWDKLQPPTFPFPFMFGIAVGVRVPYAETEDAHQLRVVMERADNGERLVEIEAELQTGRPPGTKGRDLLVPMAFNVPYQFDGPMELALVAHIDGVERRRTSVSVIRRGGR
ncbi:MAG: hypothetical protein ACC726_08775 [Chloroflexota bacterium]